MECSNQKIENSPSPHRRRDLGGLTVKMLLPPPPHTTPAAVAKPLVLWSSRPYHVLLLVTFLSLSIFCCMMQCMKVLRGESQRFFLCRSSTAASHHHHHRRRHRHAQHQPRIFASHSPIPTSNPSCFASRPPHTTRTPLPRLCVENVFHKQTPFISCFSKLPSLPCRCTVGGACTAC